MHPLTFSVNCSDIRQIYPRCPMKAHIFVILIQKSWHLHLAYLVV